MPPIVRARDVQVHYPLFKGFVQRLLGGGHRFVHAVDDITFDIQPGEVFGLVGESGCGKSTTGRALLGLAPVTGGEVVLEFPRQEEGPPRFVRPIGVVLICLFLWGSAVAYALNGFLALVPPLGAFTGAPQPFLAAWLTLATFQGFVAIALWRMSRWSRRPARFVAGVGAFLSFLTIPWGLAPMALYLAIFVYMGTPGPRGLLRRSGWLVPANRFTLGREGIVEGEDDDRPLTRLERWLVGPRAVPIGGFSWVLKLLRSKVQVVYQDPHAALNPALTIGEQIEHALAAHWTEAAAGEGGIQGSGGNLRRQLTARALQLLEDVGLRPPDQFYAKFPTEISGGQKQRVVIARALAPRPLLLVADEPVALLDMSIRAKVLELMLDLKRKYGLTYVFITHDLATAKLVCDRIGIMYLGRIVEMGESVRIYADPKHPYTRALLQAIPIPDPGRRHPKVLPKGEVPDAVYPPAGCRFHPRCPVALPTCGWEGRDWIAYLEERRLHPDLAHEDEASLGPLSRWWTDGLLAGLDAGTDDPHSLTERVRAVLGQAPAPLAQAVFDVRAEERSVVVQFRPPAPLVPKEVEGRVVECLLY